MTHYICATRTTPHDCVHQFNHAVQRHHGLQQAVLKSLPADQDILHVKTVQDWENILRAPRNNIITINHQDELVGQSIAIHPDASNPDADMLDMDLPDEAHRLSTFCTVMIHPAHRNRHLMQSMMNEWQTVALAQNRPHLLGCITRTNLPSWSQFLKAGLVITGAGYDPSDNSTVYYAHRDLRETPQYRTIDTITVSEDQPMADLQELFHRGYIGVAGEKNDAQYTKRLIMARRIK